VVSKCRQGVALPALDRRREYPVFLNTGAKIDNIAQYLQVVDGVIVGSNFKVDGYTWNPVEPSRVHQFMELVALGRQNAHLMPS